MTHCRHFGVCGGCAVDDRAAIDKPAILRGALIRAGYDNPPVAPLVEIPPRTRRRADLAATRSDGIALGLHRARGAEVVDMAECALLTPGILRLLAPLRELLRSLEGLRRSASVIVNLLENGPDVLLRTDGRLSGPDRRRIIAFAGAHGLPRFSHAMGDAAPEPVVILNPPVITFAGVAVAPAPGAFLQASPAGEAAIVAAVLAGLPKLAAKSRIVELYAGIGTLTFALAQHARALAQHARVAAYEGAKEAVAAQQQAIRRGNIARVTITQRDLARRPLQGAELAGAVVLDPPYAGAARQMPFLAASGVARIVYVSCNPGALAADAARLRAAGYRLLSATPIDQFPYSANLESVAVFDKA